MTGTLVPDATCDYVFAGTFAGHDYFRRLDGAYFIWWEVGGGTYTISAVLGVPGALWWTGDQAAIVGTYTNGGTATGIATVQLGTHL